MDTGGANEQDITRNEKKIKMVKPINHGPQSEFFLFHYCYSFLVGERWRGRGDD